MADATAHGTFEDVYEFDPTRFPVSDPGSEYNYATYFDPNHRTMTKSAVPFWGWMNHGLAKPRALVKQDPQLPERTADGERFINDFFVIEVLPVQ